MSREVVSAKHLLLTEQGEAWLQNFDDEDKPLARDLAGALVLVSHNVFERRLTNLVNRATQGISGSIALYAAREVCDNYRPLSEEVIDSTPRGSDIGSEGRTASIIRNIAKESPEKFLNHPSLGSLRERQVDAIFVIDDFVGSGKRCSEYLDALWRSRTLRSWKSYRLVKVFIIAYSGTSDGIKLVERHTCKPIVCIAQHCPTLDSLHWRNARIEDAKALCRKYARKARLGWQFGFRNTASLLVFEHGCPNNVPSIFWGVASDKIVWKSLFASKRVGHSLASTFPAELQKSSPVSVLIEAGKKRLAAKLALNAHAPLTDNEVLTLALFSKGKCRVETVANAAGLDTIDAGALIERCTAAGWISARRRITEAGLAELRGISTASIRAERHLPDLGEEAYYPTALRGRDNG